MHEPKEITITLKDEERTLRQKFLIYEELNFSSEDPIIQQCISETRKNFEGEPDKVSVRAALID